jgi:hypothetical protein
MFKQRRDLFARAILSCVALSSLGRCAAADDGAPSRLDIRTAIEKSLPLLEKGARGSMTERKQCFTCHNQGLPIMALTMAQAHGFAIDNEHLQSQIRFTADFLGKHNQRFLEGAGTGGQVDTAGYALWALLQGGYAPDETTAAVAEFLLLHQRERDHWESSSNRPPSEQSAITATFLALRGLKSFGTPSQSDRIQARIEQARRWLLEIKPQDTEDRVFRLRALHLVDAGDEPLCSAAEELKRAQLDNGGWAQLAEMQGDAYATGTVLAALQQTGEMSSDDAIYRRGLAYLISTQHDDGSWQVATRSVPFQTYFESGYPHGKDQFISIAAASWATMSLCAALDDRHDLSSAE